MGFGILMQDNTPVDYPFRRSGKAAEESVRLGFVPGGPYYPRSMPIQRAMGYVPGGPYYPRGDPMRALGFVPGGPYYPSQRGPGFSGRRFAGRRFGIPPGQAENVPQYNAVPGTPDSLDGEVSVSLGRFAGRSFAGTCYNVVTGENYDCDTGDSTDSWNGPDTSSYSSGTYPTTPTTGTNTGASALDYLNVFLNTLSSVAPAALNTVTAALNRGSTGNNGSCISSATPYWSPLVQRCFANPTDMANAENAVRNAQAQTGVQLGSSMSFLIPAAIGLAGIAAVLLLRK